MRETLVNLAIKSLLQTLKGDITRTFDGVNYALAGSKKIDELIAMMNNALLDLDYPPGAECPHPHGVCCSNPG